HNVPNNTQLNIDGKAGKCIKIHDQNYPETTLIPEAQFSPFTLEVFVRSNADNNGELLVKILRENGTLLTEIRQGFQNTNANKWVLQSLELDLGTIRSNNAIPSTEKMTLQASVSWLTASFEIDEFRLNPSKARLETYVYNGFGQLIAKSDVNGYMTHYDYDDLHRLKATSDDENNITSVNFYKYPSNTVTHNHIISGTAIVEGITDPNAIYYGQGMLRSKKYYDGLGRPLQIVNLNQSPSNKDVVQIYEYDAFGRETKEYLPFTDISNGGQFRSNAKLLQNIFYGSIANAFAYSEMQYDSAAIQIPIMAGAPGTSWFIGSGHEKLISFRSCNTPDVRMFDVHGNSNATFWAGSLKAEMSMDEDGNLSTIYYDKLKRKLMTDNEGAKTYFIHDDFGRLKFVIPPKAFAQMETANNFNCNAYLDGIYSYTYDAKGRIIRKDLPGKEEEIIYYDRLDRSVLTIDANSNKIFTKYDALGRPIIAGLYHGLSIPSTSDGLYEIEVSGNIGYTTNLTFPESNLEIQSINYYDHYDLDRDGTISSQEDYKVCTNTLYQNEKSNRVFGMLTASKSLLLDGSNRFITTQTFYDKKGRVIQTKAENSLDGADISYFNYEFSGTLLNDRREHRVVLNGATKSLVVENRYTYDHTRSRLIDTFQTINGGLETHISKNTYNEQDLLKRKSLGVSNGNALQDIDYKYNIRGWLTDINNVYDRSNGFNKLPVIGQQKGFGKQ
ncbi:MAG: RHS repeat protein, partial [Flavobacteriales bacterium]|nr:RHS repeat protein [Flavobacteriales bacterium]